LRRSSIAFLPGRSSMSSNRSSSQKSLSAADRLRRKLPKNKTAERKKFPQENIARLEKNGDLSYKTVRTYAIPHKPEAQARGPAADEPSHPENYPPTQPSKIQPNSNLFPNKFPQTPAPQENGNLIADSAEEVAVFCEAKHGAQTK